MILSGISLEDQVLTTWTSELKEGTKVTLDTEAPAGEEASQAEDAGESGATEGQAADQSQAQ